MRVGRSRVLPIARKVTPHAPQQIARMFFGAYVGFVTIMDDRLFDSNAGIRDMAG